MKVSRYRSSSLLALVLALMPAWLIGGCGSKEIIPPKDSPSVSSERYEQVQVTIDGSVVSDQTTLRTGQDFDVTVSFRRKVTWPGLVNKEASIQALIMDGNLGKPVINRDSSLSFVSDKDGLVTFRGRIEGLRGTGVYGFWIRENAVLKYNVNRYYPFVGKIRVRGE